MEDLLNESNALGYLRAEHRTIKELIGSCLNIDQPDFQRQAMVPLLQELEVHDKLEHEFFYPFIAGYVPENLMERPLPYDKEVEDLTRKLETIDPSDPLFKETLSLLLQRFDLHCYQEEQYLFLNMEMNTPDVHNRLVRLANQMKLSRDEWLKRMKRPRALAGTGEVVTPGAVKQRVAQEKGRNIYPPRDVVLDQQALTKGSEDVVVTDTGEKVSRGGRKLTLPPEDQRIEPTPGVMSADQQGFIARATEDELQDTEAFGERPDSDTSV